MSSKWHKEKGVVLILVLWILVILSITVLGFASYMRLQLKITKNQTERLTAYYIAKAGIDRAILELRKENNKYDALNEKWSANEDAYEDIPFGDGRYTVVVIDEESKLNINLPIKDEEAKRLFKTMLLALPEIEEDQAEAILEHRNKRGIFHSIYEVSLLKEMNQETFSAIRGLVTVYSSEEEDTDKVNLNQANREELKSRLGLTDKEIDEIIEHRSYQHLTDLLELDWMNKVRFIQLIDRITVQKIEIIPGRININTAGEEVLGALGFDSAATRSIIHQREQTPFKSISSVLTLPGIDLKGLKQLNLDLVTTRSHAFTIESVATLNSTLVKIKAVIRRDANPTGSRPRISILYWKEIT